MALKFFKAKTKQSTSFGTSLGKRTSQVKQHLRSWAPLGYSTFRGAKARFLMGGLAAWDDDVFDFRCSKDFRRGLFPDKFGTLAWEFGEKGFKGIMG